MVDLILMMCKENEYVRLSFLFYIPTLSEILTWDVASVGGWLKLIHEPDLIPIFLGIYIQRMEIKDGA